MNSIQKQTLSDNKSSYSDLFDSFEKKMSLLSISELEILMTKLRYLGNNFDPFQTEMDNECQIIMDQLEINQHLMDPFFITNTILKFLDMAEGRLYQLKH